MRGENKMIDLYDGPVELINGSPSPVKHTSASGDGGGGRSGNGRAGTMAYRILSAHNHGADPGMLRIREADPVNLKIREADPVNLKIRFDSLISHDITYVGIIQTARASGMTRFPVPYALTNCHNSLCAVGGTINEDDHVFGLSAAIKYGGIYVPANQAVIHQYAREALCKAGGMILGSDSHTRYGPLGVMGIGEGGPELVKQLLNNTYDIKAPEVVLVWLENAPPAGSGPHDIAIALCGAVYDNGFVKNKVLEFAGPGLSSLPIDFRFGIDVMTTETACLSSIWRTDDSIASAYYEAHGAQGSYKPLAPEDGAVYDAMITIDLALAEPMIAMPFHPSKAFTIKEMNRDAADILRETEREAAAQFGGKVNLALTDKAEGGRLRADQGIIAGCAGGMYDNILEAARILDGASVGDGYFSLSIYPSSMPVNLRLIKDGIMGDLIEAGALFKPCFCGPCFGAGDVPSNNGLSIRHTTRNFMNREGSRPNDGQLAAVALMDARSIAATAKNHGLLTSAADLAADLADGLEHGFADGLEHGFADGSSAVTRVSGARAQAPVFDPTIYEKRVYNGYGKPDADADLKFGPNIADWPKIDALGDNLMLRLASVIHDSVTTTDELIPSGETSSYRSNPIKLAGFTLSRRDPRYVPRALEIRSCEETRKRGELPKAAQNALDAAARHLGKEPGAFQIQIASAVFARKPGDGSAREQAASCQRVLGGGANICYEYATKRYRSNLINWGMIPFTIDAGIEFTAKPGDWIFVPGVREKIENMGEGMGGGICAAQNGAIEFDALLISDSYEDDSGSVGGFGGTPSSSGSTPGGSGGVAALTLRLDALTGDEREIILRGCLMNYYAAQRKNNR